MTEKLPISGSLPRPKSVKEAAATLKDEAIDVQKGQRCTFRAVEFTSNCPRTGQPDTATVIIEYVSNGKGLESKALKFYLWAFRDEGGFCEDISRIITADVHDAIEPTSLAVTVKQHERGGIELDCTTQKVSATRNRNENSFISDR